MRKTGYYFVNYGDDEWFIARYGSGSENWISEQFSGFKQDADFLEIDETPITRTSLAEQHRNTRLDAIDLVNHHFYEYFTKKNFNVPDDLDKMQNDLNADIQNLKQRKP